MLILLAYKYIIRFLVLRNKKLEIFIKDSLIKEFVEIFNYAYEQ